MTDRFRPEGPPIDPTMQAIRDELPREVLSYAEGLRREMYVIARRYGVEKPADIGPKIASGEVSMADADRMVELKTALERAVETKRVPAAELRDIEHRKSREKDDILASVGKLAELYVELEKRPRTLVDLSKPRGWSQALARAVDKLSPFLPEELLDNKNLMREVCDALLPVLLAANDRASAGFIASMVMNRSIRELPQGTRAFVIQKIAGVIGMSDLGYGWVGGILFVKGDVSDGLGCAMEGGTIFTDVAGDNPGRGMRGGELVIRFTDNEPNGVGQGMEGGKIRLGTAGDLLGYAMSGGEIYAENVGDNAGEEMKGGMITILEHAGNELGKKMEGGIIAVASARTAVGYSMSGGRINVMDCSDAGTEMSGGMIVARDATISAGARMTGGQIDIGRTARAGFDMSGGLVRVTGHASTVGEGMTDGSIEIHGTAFHVSRARTGGKIRYHGKGAWWKNLWI